VDGERQVHALTGMRVVQSSDVERCTNAISDVCHLPSDI
jgi:hypothetical protein